MIIENLWTNGGMVNGTLGKVEAIVYLDGRRSPDLPDYSVVRCTGRRGPGSFAGDPELLCVTPITVNFSVRGEKCTMTQLPLVPASAITIHK